MNIHEDKYRKELSNLIANSDNPNDEIRKILNNKSQKLKDISEEIEKLEDMKKILFAEISTLEEIKGDMHLILDITKELSNYEKGLKEKNSLNTWNELTNNSTDDVEILMSGNYNKLYSASIVKIYNYKKKVFRVDIKLTLNDIFVRYAKMYNSLSKHVGEIKIISDGKIFFKPEDAEEYSANMITLLDKYFTEYSNCIYKEFVDIGGEVFSADTFIKYRASYVNGITVIDETFNYYQYEANIPF